MAKSWNQPIEFEPPFFRRKKNVMSEEWKGIEEGI